jgi:hypothetical protein
MLEVERMLRQAHYDKQCRWGCPVCREEEERALASSAKRAAAKKSLQDWGDELYAQGFDVFDGRAED